MNSQQEIAAVAAAVSGYRGKLFAVPPDGKSRTHRDRSLEADAGAGRRGVFEGGGNAIRGSRLVFPEDLGHRPQDRSRFDVTAVHAMCIGGGVSGV